MSNKHDPNAFVANTGPVPSDSSPAGEGLSGSKGKREQDDPCAPFEHYPQSIPPAHRGEDTD